MCARLRSSQAQQQRPSTSPSSSGLLTQQIWVAHPTDPSALATDHRVRTITPVLAYIMSLFALLLPSRELHERVDSIHSNARHRYNWYTATRTSTRSRCTNKHAYFEYTQKQIHGRRPELGQQTGRKSESISSQWSALNTNYRSGARPGEGKQAANGLPLSSKTYTRNDRCPPDSHAPTKTQLYFALTEFDGTTRGPTPETEIHKPQYHSDVVADDVGIPSPKAHSP